MTFYKTLWLVLVFCCVNSLHSQSLVVADAKTKKGIFGAEVESTNFFGITNRKGQVQFDLSKFGNKVYINHLSYEPKIINTAALPDTIFLKQKMNYLDGTTVNAPLRDRINVRDEPHQATEITKEDIENEKPATTADARPQPHAANSPAPEQKRKSPHPDASAANPHDHHPMQSGTSGSTSLAG